MQGHELLAYLEKAISVTKNYERTRVPASIGATFLRPFAVYGHMALVFASLSATENR